MDNNRTILDLLDNAAKKWPDHVAFENEIDSITFLGIQDIAQKVGTSIAKRIDSRTPVIVWAQKSIYLPALYLGAVYAGSYYAPIGEDVPVSRVKTIIETVKAKIMIVDQIDTKQIEELKFDGEIIYLDDCNSIDNDLLLTRRDDIIDTDPMYIIFTSGTTGIPTPVVTSHLAVIDFVQTCSEMVGINKNTVFGNQFPFYYVGGLRNLYIPFLVGCRVVLIDKKTFSIPVKLIELLNEKKVNTLDWVAATFALLHNFNTFEVVKPKYVNKIWTSGGVLNTTVLNYLMKHLPNATFINSYGCTEATGSVMYHMLDKERDYSMGIPLGIPFKNRRIILLDGNNPVKKGEIGEICVIGTSTAIGYFNNKDKTSEKFAQNPLNPNYPEIILRTGDLASINKFGEYIFHGRKDGQIKHMGHRIELCDIEVAAAKCNNSGECVCIYDYDKSNICLYYSGTATKAEIVIELRKKLPSYMIPRIIVNLSEFPKLFNGKYDMQALKRMINEVKK